LAGAAPQVELHRLLGRAHVLESAAAAVGLKSQRQQLNGQQHGQSGFHATLIARGAGAGTAASESESFLKGES
jgi:hypothetical protein